MSTKRRPNTTEDDELACALGEPWLGPHPKCAARVAEIYGVPVSEISVPDSSAYNQEELMAKRPKAPKPAAETTARTRPRQPDLPGTEDRAIRPLEEAAQEYADIRDRRMALNAEEVGLKAKVLRLMKHHGKQTYHRDGVSIEIVVEEESVKVKVKKAGDEDEADSDDAGESAAGDEMRPGVEAEH